MKKVVIPVAFGTLDVETFEQSYRPLFALLNRADIRPAFLNDHASEICGVPLLRDVLKNTPADACVTVFPLILNEGNEYSLVQELCNSCEILPPLLFSMKDDVAKSLARRCRDGSTNYVLLGHGSRFSPEEPYNKVVELLPGNVKLLLHHGPATEIPQKITTVPFMLVCGRHIQAMNHELSLSHEVAALHEGLLDDVKFRTAVADRIKGCL